MANIKDFATSLVVTAPSPATSGTSLVVTTGHGARFPVTPFFATVHPANQMPTLDNAEKVLVSDVDDDTMTIERGQGDTDAKSISAGWRFTNALFEDDIADLEYAIDNKEDALGFTPEDVSNKASSLISPDNTKYPTTQAVVTALDDKANDDAVVKLTGNQTISDVKTFTSSPIVPAPTTDMQAATKAYVDANISGTPGGSNTQVQFNDGGSFGGEDTFTFDKTKRLITLGKSSAGAGAESTIQTPDATGTNTGGNNFTIKVGEPSSGDAQGGNLILRSGGGSGTGDGGNVYIQANSAEDGVGGSVRISAGDSDTNDAGNLSLSGGFSNSGNNGNVIVEAGHLQLYDQVSGDYLATFDPDNITADRTYTLQDGDGTLAFLSDIPDTASGVILKSPDGTLYRVTVANGGTLAVAAV